MARVYTDWRTLPDDPNRVGDEDYEPMRRYRLGSYEEDYEDVEWTKDDPVVYLM
jgi:hypothetical protein